MSSYTDKRSRPAPAAPRPPAADKSTAAPVRVRATAPGFYRGNRIRKGVVFTLLPGATPARWMEVVPPSTPDELAALRAAGGRATSRSVASRPVPGASLTMDAASTGEPAPSASAGEPPPPDAPPAPTGAKDVLPAG